jgi:hypothetical protein
MSKILKYEQVGNDMLTPCPYKQNHHITKKEGEYYFVGDCCCRDICPYFWGQDKENQTVICTYEDKDK